MLQLSDFCDVNNYKCEESRKIFLIKLSIHHKVALNEVALDTFPI